MHTPTRTRFTPALLLTLALTTTPTRADTFTWAGATANFSDPTAWSGPAPSATGSPTTQLLFSDPLDPIAAAYTATLDTPAPFTLNTLIAGSSPLPISSLLYPIPSDYITLSAAPGAGLLFTGPKPTITALPYVSLTINAPLSSASDLTLTGNHITLTSPLSFTNNANLIISGSLIYQNNAVPTGLNQTIITGTSNQTSSLFWTPTATGNTTLSFGTGPITLNQAHFGIGPNFGSDPNPHTTTFTNLFIIQNFAVIEASSQSNANTTIFSGPINLGGELDIWAFQATAVFAGTITLNQSGSAPPAIEAFTMDVSSTSITGNIIDDPDPTHTTRQPLRLANAFVYDPANTFTISGTANSYSVGTEIYRGDVFVAPNSSLGTGNVTIDLAATLHLAAPTNLAPGKKALVQQAATLAISFDQDPSPLIDPASVGTLALDTTFSTPLNMAILGNGLMSLSSTNNGTYSAPTLAPNSDHVYRFTTFQYNGLSTLTLLHSVLIDYNNIPSSAQLAGVTLDAPNSYSGGSTITGDVYVNAPGALGSGNVTIGSPPTYNTNPGRLFLTVPNVYAPSAVINVYGTLAATGPNGSIPLTTIPPILHPGSTLTLGDNLTNNSDRYPDSMPINLNTSTLQLNGTGTTTETVGPLSFSGLSTIILQNPISTSLSIDPPTTPNTITLTTPSITHAPHAVLFLELTNIAGSGGSTAFNITSPPPLTNGMLPPYMQTRSYYSSDASEPTFLSSASGTVIPATFIPFPTTGGNGTEIADIPGNTDADGNPIPFSLPMNTSIYALRTGTSIANPSASPATLHILSGGLIVSPTLTNQNILIAPNIDFANAEAYINTTGLDFGGETTEFSGQVTATHGITKFGTGAALFSNPNNNISGPLTIYEGALSFPTLPDPTSSQPIIIFNDAALLFTSTTTLSRPIQLSASTLNYGINAVISVPAGQSLTLAAPITGTANVDIFAGNLIDITTPITLTTGISFTATSIHLASHITAAYASFNGNLTGAGTISTPQPNNLSQGAISPGDHPGDLATITFDIPSLDISNEETLQFDLTPAGLSDHLFFTGSFTIDPDDPADTSIQPPTIALNFLAPPTGQTYTLLTASSLTGQFTTVTGLPANYTLDYTPTSLLLLPTSQIPEPATLTLLILALPTLLSRKNHPSK